MGGHARFKQPRANFQDSSSGTASNRYGLSNTLVKINFAYVGYKNAFNVINELKMQLFPDFFHDTILTNSQQLIKALTKTTPASLPVVATLYILCNIA